jgi:hypothetical protein
LTLYYPSPHRGKRLVKVRVKEQSMSSNPLMSGFKGYLLPDKMEKSEAKLFKWFII